MPAASSSAVLREPGRRVEREVRDDDAGAGPRDPDERLEGGAPQVDPASLGRGVQGGVLAAHLVRGNRHVVTSARRGHDVEVWAGGLHHEEVGALREVVAQLGHRFAPVPPPPPAPPPPPPPPPPPRPPPAR